MEAIRVFCPATIANLSCGFDVLGLCLDGVGDFMEVRRTPELGLRIDAIFGAELTTDPLQNVATVAAQSLLNAYGPIDFGLAFTIDKRIRAGSGIGSSSASSAGAVYAVNALLGHPFSPLQLIDFAMDGEAAATGNRHADNVAPALLGGATLVRSTEPLDVIGMPSIPELTAVIVHPHISIRTADARAVLPTEIPLKAAVQQWGNVGALVAALYRQDLDLLGRSLNDVIVEPHRKALIPDFDRITQNLRQAGALGAGISGSGPSVFGLFASAKSAEKALTLLQLDQVHWRIPQADLHLCPIRSEGVSAV